MATLDKKYRLHSIFRHSVAENSAYKAVAEKEATGVLEKIRSKTLTIGLDPNKEERRLRVISTSTLILFRWIAVLFAIAQLYHRNTQTFAFTPQSQLLVVVLIYTIIKSVTPQILKKGYMTHLLILLDLIFSFVLISLTRGIESPFVVYSLCPLFTASLLQSGRITIGMLVVTSIGIILTGMFFSPYSAFNLLTASYTGLYLCSAALGASLPYMVNLNLRSAIRRKDIAVERQRLSHEIHDGAAQTITSLCWEIKLLKRKLLKTGTQIPELTKIENIAEKARLETRDSLALLRSYSGNGDFLAELNDYTSYIKDQCGVIFAIESTKSSIPLSPEVEIQLLRICQEAINNIRKHADAHFVSIKIDYTGSRALIIIHDDGQGFDPLILSSGNDYSYNHGLRFMKERAELIGGTVNISSTPGQGTSVQIRVPAQIQVGRWLW